MTEFSLFGEKLYLAMIENIFGLLKSELLYLQDFRSMEHFKNVAGSSTKGSRKGGMVKGVCFVPLKTRKALVLQGLLC